MVYQKGVDTIRKKIPQCQAHVFNELISSSYAILIATFYSGFTCVGTTIATLQKRNSKFKTAFKRYPSLSLKMPFGGTIITEILTKVKKGSDILSQNKRKESFLKLDALAKARNVTFYKLSEELGLARSTFSDWKSGKSMPKTDKLIKIANYFGVDIGYFIE